MALPKALQDLKTKINDRQPFLSPQSPQSPQVKALENTLAISEKQETTGVGVTDPRAMGLEKNLNPQIISNAPKTIGEATKHLAGLITSALLGTRKSEITQEISQSTETNLSEIETTNQRGFLNVITAFFKVKPSGEQVVEAKNTIKKFERKSPNVREGSVDMTNFTNLKR